MIKQDVREILSAIPHEEWEKILKKCYNHGRIKLFDKTDSGAHTKQRLGVEPVEFYVSAAYTKICSGERIWDYNNVPLDRQIMSIMDSLMCSEVKKYKVEKEHDRTSVIVQIEQLDLFTTLKDDEHNLEKDDDVKNISAALNEVCEKNEQYAMFVDLLKQNLGYDAICEKMKCTKNEVYRLRENLIRRAKGILKAKASL